MISQIRITKTSGVKNSLATLKKRYPALEEAEIIKYLISKDVEEYQNEQKYYLDMLKTSFHFDSNNDADKNLYSKKDIKPLVEA